MTYVAYPDDPASFGTPNADDEEWDSDMSAWTAETSPSGPNTVVVNDTFAPSRLRLGLKSTSNDTVSLYKSLTIDTDEDVSLTFDAAATFNLNYKSIEVGFRASSAGSSAAMVAILGHAGGVKIVRRKYSNIGTSSFSDQNTNTLSGIEEARRLFIHLQRVSNNWTMWYSIDALSWGQPGNVGTSDSFAVALAWIRMSGFGAAVPYMLANNWIRFNRFFL